MKRIFATLRWNVVVQLRNGFYIVSAFFVLVWVGLLRQLPHDGRLNFGLIVSGLMVLDLAVTSYFVAGALVLMEKSEGTLASLVVTPLRAAEYLLARMGSLMLLALLEGFALVLLIYGIQFQPLLWLVGIICMSGLYSVLGFAVIARYRTINECLLPAGLALALLVMPVVPHLGLLQSPIFYLHPIQPALMLLRAAVTPVAAWQIAYGIAGSLFWLGVGFAWARRVFMREIIGAR